MAYIIRGIGNKHPIKLQKDNVNYATKRTGQRRGGECARAEHLFDEKTKKNIVEPI